MADGHLNKCIECVKARVGKHREENLETIQAYDRKRGRTEERKSKVRERAPKYNKLRDPEHKKKFPEKYIARNAVNNSIRDGRLTRLSCEECSNPVTQAHHEDYSKPLDVVWLCVDCHMNRHRKYE
jgi:hypothetical protein